MYNTDQSATECMLSHHLNLFYPAQLLSEYSRNIITSLVDHAELEAVNCLREWKEFPGISDLDPLHSRQYCTFLVKLGLALFKNGYPKESDIISCLNKSLHGCEIFGHVAMPLSFLIGHTLGIVLGRAEIGENIVIQHNVTIGIWDSETPLISDSVVLLHGCTIAGRSLIGSNSVIAPGVKVVNRVVPSGVLVFQGEGGGLVFKENKKSLISKLLAIQNNTV